MIVTNRLPRTVPMCRVRYRKREHHYRYDFAPEMRGAVRLEIARQVAYREVRFGWLDAIKIYRLIDREVKRVRREAE